MRDELLSYYERELGFLRQMGARFAEKYPKVAGRLLLEPGRCEDPHVERLIEAFSLLAARIHLRIDDEFPEITQALLGILYPHYTRPIPSLSIAEMQLDSERGKSTAAAAIPRGTMLYSRPVGGVPCKFRTCYDTKVWPLTIADASWRTPDRIDPPVKSAASVAALRLEVACWQDVQFGPVGLDRLQFCLHGDPNVTFALYELLSNNCHEILLRDPRPKFRQRLVPLPKGSLRPLGFGSEHALLPYPARSFDAYRLLQEYFAFPEKFLFFELNGLDVLGAAGFEDRAEILFLFSSFERSERQEMLELGVNAKTFRLGCTPIVNLFPHTAEPILLTQTRDEYAVTPDFRRPDSLEVFSIDQVICTRAKTGEAVDFQPFFSFQHSLGAGRKPAFWNAVRRTVPGSSDGLTEMYLSLCDRAGIPVRMELDTLTTRCSCTNADLPSRLPFGSDAGDFEMESGSAIHRIVALRKPTPTVRPSIERDALWRLISHLSLNYLSLVEGGRDALQEILRLYEFTSQPHLDQQIDGITDVRTSRQFARVVADHGISYVRGMRVEMSLDEDRFVGGGSFLFAAVLEHFLAQYVSMNSFSQLVVLTSQRKEPMREWDPKAGSRILL